MKRRRLLIFLLLIFIITIGYSFITKWLKKSTLDIAEFITPTNNQYMVGEITALHIELKNIDTSINVVQADLGFDPAIIQIIDVTTVDTFLHFLVQKEWDNDKGYVRLSGGLPNPGYDQTTGRLGTVYFKAIKPGSTNMTYLDSSLVLANDGQGTNLLSKFPTITFMFTSIDPQASSIPDLTIKNQATGDKDQTMMNFTEHTNDLPKPAR